MFNTYMGLLIWPMIAFGWVVNLMQRGTASLKRINEILQEKPSIAAPANARRLPEPVRGEIEFRDVELRYGETRVLNGIDLRIPAGAVVAIVGHTGSGKTTLADLVPRLIDPSAGAVLLDGVDLRELDPAEVRRQVGFVPQETFLFSATIAENIAFGVKDATEEQVRSAAELAGLGPDIAAFPDGYQTVVGERGITLSGGQKQRAAIARAILRDPRVLILDDALSSVDTLTEERILTGLAQVTRERTTILISHRVSTVRSAGRIFVLEQRLDRRTGNPRGTPGAGRLLRRPVPEAVDRRGTRDGVNFGDRLRNLGIPPRRNRIDFRTEFRDFVACPELGYQWVSEPSGRT